MRRRLIASLAVVALTGVAMPASADPRGFIEDEFQFGFFYGTFDESPNIAMFAGGPIEDFCTDDPGTAPLRVFLRKDGTVDLRVNDKNQPIHLYHTEQNDIPTWLGQVCPGIAVGDAPPESFANGTADLKVRMTVVSDDFLEIFNSVNGKAIGNDGTEYKVRGTADLIVENGVPVGDPKEFVGFKLTEIRR